MSLAVGLTVLAGTFACLGLLAVIAGVLVANYLDDRDARRDSEREAGRIGGREPGAPPPARVLVLPDAGPPTGGDRARLPGLRPATRPAEPSPHRH